MAPRHDLASYISPMGLAMQQRWQRMRVPPEMSMLCLNPKSLHRHRGCATFPGEHSSFFRLSRCRKRWPHKMGSVRQGLAVCVACFVCVVLKCCQSLESWRSYLGLSDQLSNMKICCQTILRPLPQKNSCRSPNPIHHQHYGSCHWPNRCSLRWLLLASLFCDGLWTPL